MNRREFVIGTSAALVLVAAGGSCVYSSCPLDTEGTGICTGPCSAFIDLNGDSFCDRVPPPPVVVQAAGATSSNEPDLVVQRVCPFGLQNDPYPGECNLYVDTDGDGICDLSRNRPAAAEGAEASVPAPEGADEPAMDSPPTSAAGAVLTACPLGLINDPYPGECRRYEDANANGLCDLSEPALIASGEIAPLPTPTQAPTPEPGATQTPRPQTACPYGLVNDPYPGECRRYVDLNGNGICDLSEPELIASGAVSLPSVDTTEHSGGGQQSQSGGQQRRRGKGN